MNLFKSFSEDLKGMFSTPQSPASLKPSTNPRRIWIAVIFVGSTLIFGVLFGILAGHGRNNKNENNGGANGAPLNPEDPTESGPQVIQFSNHGTGGRKKGIRASQGTLVRLRLLNSVETFDTVPAFAQVSDYALGQSYYGWTVLGDASSDGTVERIKMVFKTLKDPASQSAFDLNGKALSLDGTLGIRAEKIDGAANRTIIGGAKAGASGMGSALKQSSDLSGFLLNALIQGLQGELGSDLGAAYNRASALRLKPGQEFFVQLTESF